MITTFEQIEILGHSLYTYGAILLIILSVILLLTVGNNILIEYYNHLLHLILIAFKSVEYKDRKPFASILKTVVGLFNLISSPYHDMGSYFHINFAEL